ncbi:S58 family peptidase [Halobacillus fulvus]|nr:S58 family peptidase [Halobacillus fulvus]
MIQKRIRDYGIHIGVMQPGNRNKITDVKGVTVGHKTIVKEGCHTGVTVIIPHQGHLFKRKVLASSHVINGFGKTMGTIQIEELGTLETPIALTNTLNSGTAFQALTEYMLERTPEIGRTTGTVNPVIGECNDMHLNDIRARLVEKQDIFEALDQAGESFEEGAVGAGAGMVCYSLKGGIGSASRRIQLDYGTFTLGVLVLTNFGQLPDLMIDGKKIGRMLHGKMESPQSSSDRGSVMVIVATDLPVSERQLKRILKRATTGLSRTGSTISNGSGEIVLGFSTAVQIPHEKPEGPLTIHTIHEEDIDPCFRAVGEAVEEAVLNSLITASSTTGREGTERHSLRSLLEHYGITLT